MDPTTIYIRFMRARSLVHYAAYPVWAIPRLGNFLNIKVGDNLTHTDLQVMKVSWFYTTSTTTPAGVELVDHIEIEVA